MSTALALNIRSTLPASFAKMLATPSNTKVEQLWWQFKSDKKNLDETHEMLKKSKSQSSLTLLLRSSLSDLNEMINCSISGANIVNADKILQQTYWNKALALTDVLYHMPTDRKREWNESIRAFDFPDFTLDNLYSTLTTLLLERDKFVAERVEGVFKALSKEHVTNCPQGFYKRMIISGMHDGGSPCSTRSGYISDLRIVIGRLLGRENDHVIGSYQLVDRLMNHTGEWVDIDGGSIRIRVYKKGTAHLEVHPDLAWQLNEILATLYPRAIPSEFRTKSKKTTKPFNLSSTLLNYDVVNALSEMQPSYSREEINGSYRRGARIENRFEPRYPYSMDKHLLRKVSDVMKAIGGVEVEHHQFQFDYDATEIIETVYFEGRIPDKFSYQYYPTPFEVGEKMADIFAGVEGLTLEPSAGQGGLAQFMDDDTQLVEVSSLHCDILKAKGFKNVECADFLIWADKVLNTNTRYGGILMNPPFSEGRSREHLEAAVSILDSNGRIVALVTESVAERFNPKGFDKKIEVLDANEFKGVSVDLAILTLEKQAV